MTKEVAFEPVDGTINNRMDDAYRAKHGSTYLSPMIGARARSGKVLEYGIKGGKAYALVQEMRSAGKDDSGLETFLVTKWTPIEISIVSVPADPTVGIGRSKMLWR